LGVLYDLHTRHVLVKLLSVFATVWLLAGCSTALAPSDTTQTATDGAANNELPASDTRLLSTTPETDGMLEIAGETHAFTLTFDRAVEITDGTLTAQTDGHAATFDWPEVATRSGTNASTVTVDLPARLMGDAVYTFTLDGGLNGENARRVDLGDATLRFTTPAGKAGPVQNLQAIVGDAATEIRFQAPTQDGGSQVTAYTVEQRASDSTQPGDWTPIETSTLEANDAGVYAVAVDNLFNGQRYDVRVTAVNESGVGIAATTNVTPSPVPTAPTLQLTPGENLIKLKLGLPAYLGSDTLETIVTEYRLSESDPWLNADTVWVDFLNLEFELRDLNPGEAVQLRAAYENPNGVGAFASAVATPYGQPQPVQNLTLDAGDGELTVTFDPPSNSGGVPITQYEVTYGPGSDTNAFTQTTSSTTVTLDGLTNGETTHVSVKAVNDLGYKSDVATRSAVVQPVAYQLAGHAPGGKLGRQVSISGNRMAAISQGANGYAQLDLYAFNGGWTLDETFDVNELVEAADAQSFSKLNYALKQNTPHIDISLDGQWLALGLPDVRFEYEEQSSGWASDRIGLVLILEHDATHGWSFDPTQQIWNDTNGIEWLFGWDVELSGTTLAVAAPFAGAPTGSGKVVMYEFNRTSGTTDNPVTLNIPPATPNASDGAFGETVAIDGDRVAVGSYLVDAPPNHAFVFQNGSGTWAYEFTTDALAPFRDSFFNDDTEFEIGVALNGDYLAVSEPTANSFAGRVTLYHRSGGVWSKEATLTSSSNSDYFGYQVGFADGHLIATAHNRNRFNPTSQVHCLDLASEPAGTLTLDDVASSGVLGQSTTDVMALDTDGNQLVVGRPWAGGAGRNAGEILVIPDASRLCTDGL
jgi:hypothetical protein